MDIEMKHAYSYLLKITPPEAESFQKKKKKKKKKKKWCVSIFPQKYIVRTMNTVQNLSLQPKQYFYKWDDFILKLQIFQF